MDFVQFATAHGLIIRHIEHGKWVRVPTDDHHHKRNGAYFYGGDYAHIQNWATMDKVETWFSDKPTTPQDQADLSKRMDESRKLYAQERSKKQCDAARKAKWILGQCELDKHPYMIKKGFPDLKVNVWRKPEPLMVVPMYCRSEICGIQIIGIDGDKKFLSGQRTNDAYFKIGNGSNVFITEGFASAISLNAILACMKHPSTIYVTFSVGNAKRIAKTHPGAFWIADHDVSGVGQKAASESGCRWWMPEQAGWDVNDLYIAKGLFQSSQLLRKALK